MQKFLARLCYKYGDKGIRNLMYYISGGMLILFICAYLPPLAPVTDLFWFSRDLIFRGQVWRLITFVFNPVGGNILFFLISLYFYVFIANTLEQQWGTFKFNIFYFVGVLGCIIAGLITGYASNIFLNLSLFLAFAALFPEMQIMLFFIIPVKVKWLAWFDCAIYGFQLVVALLNGDWSTVALILFSLANLFLFFGGDYFRRIKNYFEIKKRQAAFRRGMNKF